jgi:hypothetical protein
LATDVRAAGVLEPAEGRDVVAVEVGVLVAADEGEMTGAGAGCALGCDGTLARGFGAAVAADVGASGVGASVCVRLVREEPDDTLAGASAIRGVASLRAPTGGLSGSGPDAANAGTGSAAASSAAHAATAIPLRRSVRRRDDVLVDIRPSLVR